MTAQTLYDLIDSLVADIAFSYKGLDGAICPISRASIHIGYGGSEDNEYKSVSEAMSAPLFNGKSLNEIAEQIEIY